jgi:hypothetical protein
MRLQKELHHPIEKRGLEKTPCPYCGGVLFRMPHVICLRDNAEFVLDDSLELCRIPKTRLGKQILDGRDQLIKSMATLKKGRGELNG